MTSSPWPPTPGLHRPIVVGAQALGALVALTCAWPPRTRCAPPSWSIRHQSSRVAARRSSPIRPGRRDRRGRFVARRVRRPAVRAGRHRPARGDDRRRPKPRRCRSRRAAWQAIADFDGAAVLPRVQVPVLLVSAGEPEPASPTCCRTSRWAGPSAPGTSSSSSTLSGQRDDRAVSRDHILST